MGSLTEKKKLLVLDLDNTLICASDTENVITHDFIVSVGDSKFWIKKRPGLDLFLLVVSQEYDIAIWSASVPAYTKAVSEKILPSHISPVFVFDRSKCSLFPFKVGLTTYMQYIKPLNKIWRKKKYGYNRSNTVVIDDKSITYCKNYGNAILIQGYHGRNQDNELYQLMVRLCFLASTTDVRIALHQK